MQDLLQDTQQVREHIETIDLPEAIRTHMLEIRQLALDLFRQKLNKVPSDILTNELTNTFLHTHVAPLFLQFVPDMRAKCDINAFINAQMNQESILPNYIQRWDIFEDQIKKFRVEAQFYAEFSEKILKRIKPGQESATIKTKILSLFSYARLKFGRQTLKKPQDIWQFLFGERFPTDANLGTEKLRKNFKKQQQKNSQNLKQIQMCNEAVKITKKIKKVAPVKQKQSAQSKITIIADQLQCSKERESQIKAEEQIIQPATCHSQRPQLFSHEFDIEEIGERKLIEYQHQSESEEFYNNFQLGKQISIPYFSSSNLHYSTSTMTYNDNDAEGQYNNYSDHSDCPYLDIVFKEENELKINNESQIEFNKSQGFGDYFAF